MATVSRGEITITNVDDGKPGETYYPHPAWMMADGTFTKVYPNENLLDNPYTTTGVSWDSQVPSEPENFEVGNHSQYMYLLRYGMGSLNEVLKTGDVITISFDIEMEVGTRIRVYDSNSSQKYTIGSEDFTNIGTEKTRLSFTKTVAENGKGGNRWILEFYNGNNGDKFSISNLKIEYGEVATPYTPSPNVDYENAYPKYEGFYSDTNQVGSDNPDDYKPWTPFMGPQGGQGPKGDSAPLISLSGATQAITVDKDGKITPASSFSVTGTAVNTAISNWTYSLNGGNFGSAVPTGVTRSGNTVTIDPTKAVFDTFTIKAADATVSDVFTISRIKDGGEGPPGADAYTVFLTNESYTFAGSTTSALAGSTTTEVIVYKGISKITPTSITVGTMPTGLSSSVSGSIITLTATTALVSKSGTVPITIIADGKTFTKQFAYALSLQGGKGDPGDPGKGVSAEEISYAISQDGVNPPTSGWSGTRPTPKAGWYMWTRTRFKYTDNTYSAYFYLVAQQGNDAIVISDTAPANPTKGTLWQDSSVVPQIIKVFDGTAWSMWGMPIDNLLATNILSENGVFKRLEGAEIVNTFSYTDSGVTYTGTTTIKDGNVTIARTGSDGSTWTTTMDRVQGFVDTYKASSSSPARIAQLGQGKLYLAESGVGGYLPAAAVNPASWTNLSYAPGFTTAENNPCQYRKVQIVDGSWELQLRGQIKPTSGDFSTTASPVGGILPVGFRPIRNELVPAADSTKKGARVVVLASGEIQLNTPNGGNYVSFGGIRIAL